MQAVAKWQDVGVDNLRAAVELYDGSHYRSATSRFYYAVFSVLTSPDVRARDYLDLMELAEDTIRTQKNLKVLLLPVLPGD